MNSSCAKSHMSLPLPVHTLRRVLTLRTSLYTYIDILTNIHISYCKYFCVWLRVVRTHICLCPCECSQLEPLWIHTYAHKYTFFILQILLCMTPCCANSANSHMSVPLWVLTVRTSLYTCIYSEIYIYIHISYHKYFYMWTHVVRTHICLCPCECSQLEPLCIHRYSLKYTYFILQILLYVNPCCANSHMSVPLRVLRVRTSLYTCIYSEIYIYHITNTFICKPMLCGLTYVCALASAHS